MTTKFTSRRIDRLPPYLFARIDGIKSDALARGVDVIDLGVGDPDIPPPPAVLESLKRHVHDAGAHNYSSYSGLPRLREAFAAWYEKRYGIAVDPHTEVLPLIGTKEGVGHIFFSALDPGDEVLLPEPGYPVYNAATALAGATPVHYALREEQGYLPDGEELGRAVTAATRMMWLNYPSNPTTAMASREVFETTLSLARQHGILVCHDTAYAEIVFDGNRSLSILEIPGAKECAVEFHSLSKTYCMPGWRVGFVIGNAEAIAALSKVKTNLDSGIFIPVQEAAITALIECDDGAEERRLIFQTRRDRFVGGCRAMGWQVPLPPATFYVWAPVPPGFTSMEFTLFLLEKTGIICTPGTGFGENGEGYVRMSLTSPDERLDEAIARLAEEEIQWTR